MFEAKIIKDSICNGHRLTTMQVTHPRIVHAEFNTHCAFARNASSSRAIPFAITVKNIQEDPFIPLYWGENQSGMQAAKEIDDWKKDKAKGLWLKGRDEMVKIATELASKICSYCEGSGVEKVQLNNGIPLIKPAGVAAVKCAECNGTGEGINLHKQLANRLTETWAWITVCVTGDWPAWSNYFALRCHPDAQPEIRHAAYLEQKEYFESIPEDIKVGDWHTPYIRPTEFSDIVTYLAEQAGGWAPSPSHVSDYTVAISAGRCARTSYLTQEGIRSFSEDIRLHDRLKDHVPLHACYDDKTEVLTEEGWVNWSLVDKNRKLAAFDISTEQIKFENPSGFYSFPYKSYLYYVRGQAVDLAVTPNHNMVIKTRKNGGKWTPLKLIPAEEIYDKSVAYVKTGTLSKRKLVTNPFGIDPIVFSKFVGLFLGDGHAPKDTRNIVTFHFKRERKVKFLYSLGLSTKKLEGNVYTVDLPNISKWCRDNLYAGVDKVLPNEYLQAPKTQVNAVLEGLRNSDGSSKRNTWIYYSTSLPLVNSIQAMATLNNIVVTLNTNSTPTGNSKPVYLLNFSLRKYPRVEFVKGRSFTYTNSLVPYDGTVYCATVSTGALVVRRKGKVIISGNSPFEHVCQAMGDDNHYGKYTGWKSYRHFIPREYVTDFVPNYQEYFGEK